MLRLEMAGKTFHRRESNVAALQPTTLAIAAGEYVAVVGPSGSGKTTLLSLLGAMLAPTSGKVLLNGQSLYDLSVTARTELRGRKIGFVFQTFNLVPYLSVLENVQVPMYLAGLDPKAQRQRAARLLDKVGLADRMDHKPSELSVGQQQRAALARTLANDPEFILADEPTGNLDPAMRELVLKMLDDFHAEGHTIIVVTHDSAAASRAQRKLRLEEGIVTAEGLTKVSEPA
jgi:putative ABC transport system ATP-binding protein